MSTVHELKTWPDSFQAILDDIKTHEVRTFDRPFAVGDVLHLREFVPCPTCKGTRRCWGNGDTEDCGCASGGDYTGRAAWVRVTYLTPPGTFGVAAGTCVMSVRRHTAG